MFDVTQPATHQPTEILEPTIGLEPMTSSLPRRYSTTELRGRYDPDCKRQNYWSGKRDSNPQPSAWKADALPLSYSRFPYSTQRARCTWPILVVEGGGFEPPKAPPTDLQSVPFGRSGTPPHIFPEDKRQKGDRLAPPSFFWPLASGHSGAGDGT